MKKTTPIYKWKNDDIWRNLYELPLIETNNEIDAEKLHESEQWKIIFDNFAVLHNSQIIIKRISDIYSPLKPSEDTCKVLYHYN